MCVSAGGVQARSWDSAGARPTRITPDDQRDDAAGLDAPAPPG